VHVLASGAVDVTVSWGEAVAYDTAADRKAIARASEQSVRRMTIAALRAAPRARTILTSPQAPQPVPEPA
jgi:lyso-ornithine lipid O-acyltransferase